MSTEARSYGARTGGASRIEIGRTQGGLQARTGSAADIDRWVSSANKAKALEGNTPLNHDVKNLMASETMNELRELQTHLQRTEWMFSPESG